MGFGTFLGTIRAGGRLRPGVWNCFEGLGLLGVCCPSLLLDLGVRNLTPTNYTNLTTKSNVESPSHPKSSVNLGL